MFPCDIVMYIKHILPLSILMYQIQKETLLLQWELEGKKCIAMKLFCQNE